MREAVRLTESLTPWVAPASWHNAFLDSQLDVIINVRPVDGGTCMKPSFPRLDEQDEAAPEFLSESCEG